MRRQKSDRGAVAVIVALMMVVIMACAALVIDIGAAYRRKSLLQNAADAGALAIAEDCAMGRQPCTVAASTPTAQSLANSNAREFQPVGVGVALNPKNGNPTSVTVTTSSTVNFSFAPAVGIPSSPVSASATASWGAVSGGPAVLPIVFPMCQFSSNTGQEQVIFLHDTTCAKAAIPGGFGWLKPSTPAPVPPASPCTVNITVGNYVPQSDQGRSIPSKCSDSDFKAQQTGQPILLPVYDYLNPADQSYHIYGYAAFRLTGYSKFQGSGGVTEWLSTNEWPSADAKCKSFVNSQKCNSSQNWIFGYFTRFVSLSEVYTYTNVTDLGATVVHLTA